MIHLPVNQRTLLSLCGIGSILFFSTALYSVWQWHADWTLAHQTLPSVTWHSSIEKTHAMIAALPHTYLFGHPLAKLNQVPITSLRLQVAGIIKYHHSETDATSKALISIAGAQSKIYKVGDMLPLGVKIYAITPTTVILSRHDQLEKLPLPRTPLHFRHHIKEYA